MPRSGSVKFILFVFLLPLLFLLKAPSVQAATAGKVVNMCNHNANINGLPGGATGCLTYIDGTWGVRTGDGVDAAFRKISGFSIGGQACSADDGNGWTECNGGWAIDSGTMSRMWGNDGYYHTNKWLYPIDSTNSWICKVQIDIFSGGSLVDFIVWRDPDRCSTTVTPPPPPPPTGNPYYTAKSPIGGAPISSLYPTFYWDADVTGIAYNNICLGTYVGAPCIYSPSTSDRQFTATQALSPSTTYYWLIYGCRPGCAGGGIGTPWQSFVTPANGTLTVNTTPVSGGVIVNGASWGTAPQSRSVTPGSYTVSFGAVANYTTPAAQTLTVNGGVTMTVTGTYTQSCTAVLPTGWNAGSITTNSASLTWAPGNSGQTGFIQKLRVGPNYNDVMNGCAGGTCVVATDLASGVSSYSLSNLGSGTAYYWRIVSYKDSACYQDAVTYRQFATLVPVITYTLTVTKAGTGTGTVTSNPAGVSCGATCSASYNSGTSVTLTAVAASGSTFSSWSGEGCSGTGTCNVSMSQARSVTATFAITTYTITASAGTGGTISPSGSVSVNSGGNKTFTATANSGYSISSVTVDGASVGAVGSYTFTNVTASHTIVASFAVTTGTISGTVFNDANGDGLVGNGESNTQTGVVSLAYRPSGAASSTAVTLNGSGGFSIANLTSGTYRLELTLSGTNRTRTEWSISGDTTGRSYYYNGSYVYYAAPDTTSFPVTVTIGNTSTVNLGIDFDKPSLPSLATPLGNVGDTTPDFTATDNGPAGSFPEGYHNWHFQVLDSTNTVVREMCWLSSNQTTPTSLNFSFPYPAGNLANGCGTGTWSALPLAAGTYTWKVEVGTGPNTQLGSGWTAPTTFNIVTTGTISGSVFKDDNSDGIKDAGETGVSGTTVYLVSTSTNVNTTSGASGGFSFSLVDPALSYRLELNPAYTWTVTKWNLNGGTSSYSYATGGAGFYTRKLSDDFPFIVAAGNNFAIDLGLKQQNTNGLTVQLYNDSDLNGIAGDVPLTGADTAGMKFDCSPVGGPCQSDLTVTAASGQVSLPGLVAGVTYTITYKPPASSYQIVTDMIVAPAGDAEYDCLGGASIPKPTSCNFTFTKDTVLKVGVSNQTLPWMQVLNGDVYSNYNANTSVPAIRINVHSIASPPTYRPVFIQGNATEGGGGLTLTRENSGNAYCNGQKCSERDWVINGYTGGIPWHGAFDSISADSGNVAYISGDYTLTASEKSKFQNGGTYFRKVVVVSGDFTINTNGVATGASDPITAFLVSRKRILVTGPTHAQELVIYGGLYAKEEFDFGTSLNSNEKPAIVIVYDPSLLLGY